MKSEAVLLSASKVAEANGVTNCGADVSSADEEPGNGCAYQLPDTTGSRSFEAITVQWNNITFKVKDGSDQGKKTIASNLSGSAMPGTLTAIMGPSGAGKTTLLNVLTGHYDKGYEGEVLINGYVRIPDLFSKQSCYVMQDDHLLPLLTVHEALTMSAGLRMPMLTKAERASKVGRLIEEWKLSDCEQTRTANLSGGQRKRLAIAQELVNNPPVVFLDEPTSGLDSVTSLMCVRLLKRLATEGHTVMCSVHAPSAKIFSHFDNLYMLSRGQCIYDGKVSDLLDYLSRHGFNCPLYHNPADYVSEIAAGDYGDCCTQLAKHCVRPMPDTQSQNIGVGAAIYGGKIMTTEERRTANRLYSFKVNHLHQFFILLKRCWLSLVRHRVATPIRFLVYLVFAVMAAATFYDCGSKASTVFQNLAFVFILLCIVVFQSLLPTVMVFPVEISVLLREHRNCWYSLRMYYLAKYIVEIFPTVMPVLLLIGIVYYPTSQPLALWRAAGVCLFCMQLSSVTQATGLVISAVASEQTAVFLAVPVVSPSFFFSGFCIPAQKMVVYLRWLNYLSPVYHVYHGILLSLYGYGREPLECDEFICLYEDPAELLAYTGSTDLQIYSQSLYLVMIEVFFRILAFFLLKWRLKRKK